MSASSEPTIGDLRPIVRYLVPVLGSFCLVFGITEWAQIALHVWVQNEGSSLSPAPQHFGGMRVAAFFAALGLTILLVWIARVAFRWPKRVDQSAP